MFFDGIVLHQLLQWHHMVSHWYAPTTIAALELNTLWDGLFHAAAWIVIILGVALLWQATRAGRPSVPNSMVAGAIMAGWGTFNIVENLVNHFILQIHHVREIGTQHVFAYDVGFFLLFGIVPTAAGWILLRRGMRQLRQGGADGAGGLKIPLKFHHLVPL
jgi:uncharacterized membrane protein